MNDLHCEADIKVSTTKTVLSGNERHGTSTAM